MGLVSPRGASTWLWLVLGRHVALLLGVRDWLAPSNGALAQVLSLQLGVTLTTGGPQSPL